MLPPPAGPSDSHRSLPVVQEGDTVAVRKPAAIMLPSFSGHRPTGAESAGFQEDELTLIQLLRIVVRRWVVAVPIFVLAVGAAFLAFSKEVPMFEASSSIRIDRSKENMGGIAANPMTWYDSPSELSTEIQVLQSRAIAQEAANKSEYALRIVQPRVTRASVF